MNIYVITDYRRLRIKFMILFRVFNSENVEVDRVLADTLVEQRVDQMGEVHYVHPAHDVFRITFRESQVRATVRPNIVLDYQYGTAPIVTQLQVHVQMQEEDVQSGWTIRHYFSVTVDVVVVSETYIVG